MPLFINKVMLAGNLTRDPQLRFLANETAVASFGIAINKRYKDRDGGQQEKTTFVDVECWGRTAELVGQYLTKGRNCYIEGELKLDQWEDKDGNKRSTLKVNAQVVQFIGGQQDSDRQEQKQPPPRQHVPPRAAPPASLNDDGPPF